MNLMIVIIKGSSIQRARVRNLIGRSIFHVTRRELFLDNKRSVCIS